MKAALKVATALDPAAINQVLSLTSDWVRCSCISGENRPRCFQKFSANDIYKVRGEWVSSPTAMEDMVSHLRHCQSGEPLRENNIEYYIQGQRVCPKFFIVCLGISREVRGQISNLVRGKEAPVRYRPSLPCDAVDKDSQYDTCVRFWNSWFGERCPENGDGHRYYPVNLAALIIYNNWFWPWWKDDEGHWPDQNKDQNSLPPGTDRRLFDALSSAQYQNLDGGAYFDACMRGEVPLAETVAEEPLEDKHEVPEDGPTETYMDDDDEISDEDLEFEIFLNGKKVKAGESIDDEFWQNAEAIEALKALQREKGFPAFSTFMRARYDKQFKDVKRREKHFHCRCTTCQTLADNLHKACHSAAERAEYNKKLRDHHCEIKYWRRLEKEWFSKASSAPELYTVLSYDDTSAMGFPRMTRRPVKSVPNDRVYMVPWNITNHGTRENTYIYDMKHKWKHGADRLCSNLFAYITRIKTRPDNECTHKELLQKNSRKLVLMGDNCPENKGNMVFAFMAELVMRGWYDEIEMLFGPVGHTHNGNDAVHFVHNNIAGNYVSITPAELFLNFRYAWHDEVVRPHL